MNRIITRNGILIYATSASNLFLYPLHHVGETHLLLSFAVLNACTKYTLKFIGDNVINSCDWRYGNAFAALIKKSDSDNFFIEMRPEFGSTSYASRRNSRKEAEKREERHEVFPDSLSGSRTRLTLAAKSSKRASSSSSSSRYRLRCPNDAKTPEGGTAEKVKRGRLHTRIGEQTRIRRGSFRRR